MNEVSKMSFIGWASRYAAGLRFPVLFVIVAALFLIDLFVPDLIPFADEILLALITVLLGTMRRRRPPKPPRGGP
jgi:hypothetical protein